MGGWKWAVPVLIATCVAGLSQETGRKANDLSGAEMYQTYCAACHGTDGKGGGPAAVALKKTPPDLTMIASRNKGRFPDFRIAHIIDGYEVVASHGSREMPVWGDFFRDKQRDETILQLREHNLTEYIRSIQRK